MAPSRRDADKSLRSVGRYPVVQKTTKRIDHAGVVRRPVGENDAPDRLPFHVATGIVPTATLRVFVLPLTFSSVRELARDYLCRRIMTSVAIALLQQMQFWHALQCTM